MYKSKCLYVYSSIYYIVYSDMITLFNDHYKHSYLTSLCVIQHHHFLPDQNQKIFKLKQELTRLYSVIKDKICGQKYSFCTAVDAEITNGKQKIIRHRKCNAQRALTIFILHTQNRLLKHGKGLSVGPFVPNPSLTT